jgi:hypothetical protein
LQPGLVFVHPVTGFHVALVHSIVDRLIEHLLVVVMRGLRRSACADACVSARTPLQRNEQMGERLEARVREKPKCRAHPVSDGAVDIALAAEGIE